MKKIDLTCLTTPTSRLQYLAVDYDPADGDKCHVYVTDAANRAVIAYDVAAAKGARVVLPKAIAAGCARRDVLYAALVRADGCGGEAAALVVTYLSGARAFALRAEYLRKGLAGKMSDLGPKPEKMVSENDTRGGGGGGDNNDVFLSSISPRRVIKRGVTWSAFFEVFRRRRGFFKVLFSAQKSSNFSFF